MANFKTCSSCGADNDLICDICMFCKKPLGRGDMNILSNEELIQRTSEWIEKSRLSTMSIQNPRFDGKFWSSHQPTIELTNSEIRSLASKYLSTLYYRSSLAPELLDSYNKLNSEYLAIAPKKNVARQIQVFLLMIPVLVITVVALIFGSQMDNQTKNKVENETARIESVIKKIEVLTGQERYEEALILADQIHWQFEPNRHAKDVEQTDVRRESLKKSITEMMKKRLE